MDDHEVGRAKKKRARYEVLIILIVIVAAVIAGFGIFKERGKVDKGQLLRTELEQIRAAVSTYKALNKVNPADLESLTKLTYSFEPGEKAIPYLQNVKVDKKGQLLDPFGHVYNYNPRSGWVASTTPGYLDW